jgi:hypothetical protein
MQNWWEQLLQPQLAVEEHSDSPRLSANSIQALVISVDETHGFKRKQKAENRALIQAGPNGQASECQDRSSWIECT